MSRATADVARMLALIPWLLERPGASLAETAETFGVRVKDIRRDLDHLDFCGLPGLGGGDLFEVDIVGDRVVVSMADELRRPLRPTAREALQLIVTADAVTDVVGDDVPALKTAVEKVRRALGISASLADVVTEAPSASLDAVRTALRDGVQLRLSYQGRNDASPRWRTVDPWLIRVEDGLWYLHGFDCARSEPRAFRLDRIAELAVLADPITQQAPDDLPPPRYRPAAEDLEVRIATTARGRWLLDVIDVDTVEEVDGQWHVSLHTDAPLWIARLVLMAGGDARVVEPQHLRRTVADLAREALTRYADDRAT